MEDAPTITTQNIGNKSINNSLLQRKKSFFLVVMLIINLIFLEMDFQTSGAGIIQLIINPSKIYLLSFWISIGVFLLTTASLWAFFALWKWKKYGLYLYCLTYLLGIIIETPATLANYKSYGTELIIAGYGITILVFLLTVWSIRKKWIFFS